VRSGWLIACAVALALRSQAADWPMHRGDPQLQGRANMTAPAKPDVLWTFKSPKAIKAGAAIVQGRVFVGDDSGVVHALDVTTGKEQWTFKTEGSIEATPLLLNGIVYLGSSDGRVYALDAVTGAEKWRYETADKVLGSVNYAKNPDGSGTWLIFGSYDMLLHVVDAATGKEVFNVETENYINGTPAISKNGEVVFGGCDAYVRIVSLKERKEVHKSESEAYIAGSVALDGTSGYVGNYGNQILAISIKDGAILWRYRDRNFPYFSSPALTEKYAIIGGRDKRLHCIDREKGTGVWTFQARGQIDSSPVLCGDAVIVGSEDGRLYCVNVSDGKERWAYEAGAPITASPAASDGLIVIGAEDGTVHAIGKIAK
jgi:eukaryotic-like serine/threonine-protein kinase